MDARLKIRGIPLKWARGPVRLSLRVRIVLGLMTVILPFVIAAGIGQFYLLPAMIEPLKEITRGYSDEMHPLMNLQTVLLMAAMPVNDYLIHGGPDERSNFSRESQRVEQAFKAADPARFKLPEQRLLIQNARSEWDQAQGLGKKLLYLPDPIGNTGAAYEMEKFDAHIDRAVQLLGQTHDYFNLSLEANTNRARNGRIKATALTVAAFVLAAGLSLAGGAVLSYKIVRRLDRLRRGTARLAAGELSHRVPVEQYDELGELAASFNIMAEQLERQQAVLQNMAEHDGLTGLANRRAFEVRLEQEIDRALRYGHPFALLILDIDHFKKVNDTYGHPAGDAVLRLLASIICSVIRPVDKPARYGGEEFAVLVPETAITGAAALAERIRSAVADFAFPATTDQPISLTVSIGVTVYPEHAASKDALIASADHAMYEAKRAGRNQVCVCAHVVGDGTVEKLQFGRHA